MAAKLPMLLLSPLEAECMRRMTAARGDRLDPRLVADGPLAGSFVLPVRVREAPEFQDLVWALNMMGTIELDPSAAWPSPEEDVATRTGSVG